MSKALLSTAGPPKVLAEAEAEVMLPAAMEMSGVTQEVTVMKLAKSESQQTLQWVRLQPASSAS
jgi:hypothetical protein